MGFIEDNNLWPVEEFEFQKIDMNKIIDYNVEVKRLAGGNWKWNPVTPENIHVGMRVRPGKDWQYGNQNSGCDGIITDAKLKHEWCKVEWDNGDKYHYRYKNEHDLDIVNSNINLKTSKNGNKSVKVQRGAIKVRGAVKRSYGRLQNGIGKTVS